jgi:hypothetical protein
MSLHSRGMHMYFVRTVTRSIPTPLRLEVFYYSTSVLTNLLRSTSTYLYLTMCSLVTAYASVMTPYAWHFQYRYSHFTWVACVCLCFTCVLVLTTYVLQLGPMDRSVSDRLRAVLRCVEWESAPCVRDPRWM